MRLRPSERWRCILQHLSTSPRRPVLQDRNTLNRHVWRSVQASALASCSLINARNVCVISKLTNRIEICMATLLEVDILTIGARNRSNNSNIVYSLFVFFDGVYFWMVAKTGSIASAAVQLHLTPQSISGQLTEFADVLGVELFRRVGRNLEVTDTGRRILSYAEDIFSTGDELMELVRDKTLTKSMSFRVGCADSLSKLIACRLLAPAMQLGEPIKLICREGRLASLIADLAIHRL